MIREMMKVFSGLFAGKSEQELRLEQKLAAAELLRVRPEVLEEFEEAYRKAAFDASLQNNNLFDKEVGEMKSLNPSSADEVVSALVERIVDELLAETKVFTYDGEKTFVQRFPAASGDAVTAEEIMALPAEMRPQFTGSLMHVDIDGCSYLMLLDELQKWKQNPDSPEGKMGYNMFRQGLDILDLDEITYQMIGMNPNSMGMWFPQLVEAAEKQDFFKIPKTKILKVPLTLLQQTRQEYMGLTSSSKAVLNQYCMKAFGLDTGKNYFIKTGTYSSKYLFQNARVPAGHEVTELGEYLLFIHWQALQMASPLATPTIYGVSTTNEWVVREYIRDKENNPCIYHGMPLHTEYRVFVDFDEQKLLGESPYWDPFVMTERFTQGVDANTPDKIHDFVIYQAYEETLMQRYYDNVDKVCAGIKDMIPDIRLTGQWSIDVMQNGDDFYLIDMALAQNSALNSCVPKNQLRPVKENWIPELNMRKA